MDTKGYMGQTRIWSVNNGGTVVYAKQVSLSFLRRIRTNAMNQTRAVTSNLILADERFSTARDLPEEACGSFSYQAVGNCQH